MIYISKISGTCKGAINAINSAINLVNSGKNVCIYKEILHNPNVIENLEKKGIECMNDLKNTNGRIVVIRTHGETKETMEYLKNNNIPYYDATCKNVLKIHDTILEKSTNAYSIIMIGKKDHPEVIGSISYSVTKPYIVENYDDINLINELNSNVLVICQTTFSYETAIKYVECIKNKFMDKNIEFINSICSASKNIQSSAIEVAKKCDVMIVIGGSNSSNTKELFNVCKKYCDSYMFSNIADFFSFLKKSNIKGNMNIGITAGASTMKYELEEYKNLMEFYFKYCCIKQKCIDYQLDYNKKYLENESNELVIDSLNQLIRMNSDGKFIRAFLIWLGYSLSNSDDYNYLPLALSYELFQTSILIHDDIIDNAVVRRGKDTIPVYYNSKYSSIDNNTSNSLALCLGDLGFYLANKMLYDNYGHNPNILKLLNEYNDIVIKTIKGEIIDVELPIISRIGCNNLEEKVFEIYSLKTSWYSIVGPFRLGMILSGNNTNDFDSILHDLGVAFQIKDDLLGIYGDFNEMGKSNSSDISEFKQTILYSYINDYKHEYIDKLNLYYGKNNLTIDDIKCVQEIFDMSGAKKYAIDKMEELFDRSKSSLKLLSNVDKHIIDILSGFITFLNIRNK